MAITTTVDARKHAIEADEAWQIISNAARVEGVKCKKVIDLVPNDDNRAEILKVAMGPSGKLRAPTVVIGSMCVVGFNEPIYTRLFAENG